jgi:hypothetical protein
MKKGLLYVVCLTGFISTLISCNKDSDSPPPPPPSGGQSFSLNGGTGGSNAVNSVYVDLSAEKQDSVKRTAWDLGFYCGADFRVIINNTTAASAKSINKTDLAAVTTADTAGFADELLLGQGFGTMDIIDNVDGDITKTVIAAIAATDADNKIYILSPANGSVAPAKDWYKLRVVRNGNGYKVQYAKLSETAVKTIDVSKDDKFNFRYASLATNSVVNVEPEKAKWDILWTLTTYKASPTIPYTFSDFVYINSLAGVQAAEVLTSTVAYADYGETHVPTTTFSNNKNVIGSNWRTASPSGTGVKTDRFYVIKDAAGNVYKLRFVSFSSSDGGERGKPVIDYKLVKQA